jgi:hypothetical protein
MPIRWARDGGVISGVGRGGQSCGEESDWASQGGAVQEFGTVDKPRLDDRDGGDAGLCRSAE